MATDARDICSLNTHEIQVSNRYRVPVSSGISLGATISRPVADGAFPALVLYDPWRNGLDGSANAIAQYYATRGYAFANLHVRGTGNSEGFSTDEYTAEETQDGVDAIEWLAGQEWCSGKVGMFGASYSAFTTLQVAALAPPALRAIAPAYFTDRRYTDDCHYKGGCLRGYYDMLEYGVSMLAENAAPPSADAVGETWIELWRRRLEHGEPYILNWLQHPVEDDYWAVGSVAGRCDRIRAAAMLIGGWNDGYPNPPLRVYSALQAPKKLLIGPWSHTSPDRSRCGPRIDVHFELLRWWDHWLKGMDNGVMDEPSVQVYRQEHEEPDIGRTQIAGGWRAADETPRGDPLRFYLHGDALTETPAVESGEAAVRYLPAASRNGGLWGAGFTLAGEQSEDSARALNFTTEPLTRDLSIFGNPTFRFHVSADVEVMPVAVRLIEVGRDGTAVLVTKGILNATRRNGMTCPLPMTPGEVTEVAFHMEATAWRFRSGSRIRASVNGSDFPNVWPTPQAGALSLHWGPDSRSHISLPVWDGGREMPFAFTPSPHEAADAGFGTAPWQVVHDVLEDRYRLVLPDGEGEMCVSHRNPAVASAWSVARSSDEQPGATVEAVATGTLSSDGQNFTLDLALEVALNGDPYFQRQWTCTTERRLL
ncbi:CocE/NonD family hydrolase [Candidatus Poribacteria bacterium]|nr:CocE/NonD family hydrolase [Candidatus Poribacteria bacterium]MBT5714076.1 CocE/NonD family hydrolase [Candidatus Poribacteria bacterium]MBT7097875.1 CocE/NonD family hydrolase [Candidatus Poribacteria bacterium]MBT7808328.1 CocE/NonD family hydrolase [Candidatus Poribacteria bacterium]